MQPTSNPQPLQAGGETGEFWQAASERRLLLKRCSDCRQAHYFPRTLCPFCFSEKTVWFEACGRGSVYTFTINRRIDPCAVIAYVRLEEDVTMLTNIVGANAQETAVDAQVELDFRPGDNGQLVPVFKLASPKE